MKKIAKIKQLKNTGRQKAIEKAMKDAGKKKKK
jgi:hypothetical protein